MKLRRRSVLKALGAFASVPLGRWLSSSVAMAQGMPPPLKFIGVYHPHGISASCYQMRAGETETSFDLNFADSALTPFDSPDLYGGRSFKNRVILFEGMDDAVAEEGQTAGHGAASCLFTGSMTTGSEYNAQHESLDYYLGRTKGLGADTRFPTLNLGVGSVGDSNADAIAHGTGGAAIRNLVDPVAVFDMVFAGFTGTGEDTGAKARAKGKSVIDFVKGDLDSLSRRLGPTEKLKLDQHLDSLRELEKRVTTVAPTGACQVPSRPKATGNSDPALNFPKVLRYNGGEPYFNRITDLQVDLLAQALSCGLTRFSTLLLADPGVAIEVDGVTLPADVHNEVAHTYSEDSDAKAVASQVLLGRLNRYYYGKIARLMQRLDEGGVLDSTLIMASSDMGNPSGHKVRNLPLILTGGANGALKFGRRLKVASDCPPNNQWCEPPTLTLTSHNRVLVSICNLFGVATDTFGYATKPALITGAYPGLV